MANDQHTIVVPSWIWKWAQEKYDMKNPATPLRDLLTKQVAEVMNLPVTPPAPASSDDKTESTEEETDRGTLFKSERGGICHFCNRTFGAGTNIVAQYRKYYHPACFDKKQDQDGE